MICECKKADYFCNLLYIAFTPDYTPANGDNDDDDDLADLIHVQEAEDGEALMSIDMERLQHMVATGQMDDVIRMQRETEAREAEQAGEGGNGEEEQ
jgi:hypothetical protein